MKSLLLQGALTLGALFASATAAQAQQVRLAVRVTNPSAVARIDEPVVISLAQYGVVRGADVREGGAAVAWQLDDLDLDAVNDELCFVTTLAPKQTKLFEVTLTSEATACDASPRTYAQLLLPSRNKQLGKNEQDIYLRSITFDERTKDVYHYVHSHGISFENELLAMRVYFDHRQTIDLYGKTTKRLELPDTQFYPTDEQRRQGYGDDVLWVGNTYGLGALRGWDGQKQLALTDVVSRTQTVVATGPVRAVVRVDDKGWRPVPGLQPVNLALTYTIYGGHRDFDVEARFTRLPSGFDSYRFATGVIRVKDSEEYVREGVRGCWGSDWPTGKDDGKHRRETVGLGICVPETYIDHQEPSNGHELTTIVRPVREGDAAVIRYKLAYTSANETFGFGAQETWFDWLSSWPEVATQPVSIGITRL